MYMCIYIYICVYVCVCIYIYIYMRRRDRQGHHRSAAILRVCIIVCLQFVMFNCFVEKCRNSP